MSTKPFTHVISGRVIDIKRHGHTASGNPIMSISLDTDYEGVFHRIGNDAALVYGIGNPEYREISHDFDLTASGRISGYTRLTE